MHRLYFATRNLGKVASMYRALSPLGVQVFPVEKEYPELQVESISEVARHKAWQAFHDLGGYEPVIALDSGIAIPSLKDFPGAYTKYVLEKIGVEGILKLVLPESRSCEFRHVIWLVCRRRRAIGSYSEEFSTTIRGLFTKKPRGVIRPWHWSELALVFVPEGEQKTLAEMSEEEYKAFGARFSPAKKLADWLLADPSRMIDFECV